MESAAEEIETMRAFIRQKRLEQSGRHEKKLAEARADFKRIMEMIVADFKPARIYQWGSLVEGKNFQDISDIDIAVAGINDPAVFMDIHARANKLTSFPLHIVQIEAIHPLYASDIVSKGVLVYERPV